MPLCRLAPHLGPAFSFKAARPDTLSISRRPPRSGNHVDEDAPDPSPGALSRMSSCSAAIVIKRLTYKGRTQRVQFWISPRVVK